MQHDTESHGRDESESSRSHNLTTHGRSERLGLSLPQAQRLRLVRVWLEARLVVAATIVIVGLVLAWLWEWSGGYAVAALAGVGVIDTIAALMPTATRHQVWSVWLDVTAIFTGMAIAGVPDSAMGVPFAYVVLSSLLLLPLRLAFPVLIYAAIWFGALVWGWFPVLGPAEEARTVAVGLVADLVFLLAFVALIMVMVRIMNRDNLRRSHHLRMQEAISRASNALLSGKSSDPLIEALGALSEATDATSVFLEFNTEDPERGLCSTLFAEVIDDGSDPDPEGLWTSVPWSTMSGREALEAGRSHALRVSEVSGVERERYERSGIKSELDIPVFVDGEWWGIIGFSDVYEEHPWARRDEKLLFTAAEMIGSYLERREARARIDRVVSDLDLQVRCHHALAECAEHLQTIGDGSVDRALAALLSATEADYAYVDENFEHPTDGLSARVVHYAERPGVPSSPASSEWWVGPYSQFPTALDALSNGRPCHVIASQLGASERAMYEADGLKAELCVPIKVRGEWRGSVAFADYQHERTWSEIELSTLRTAARMIGSFWERREAERAREELVVSQRRRLLFESAIAECSRALLMSGDDSAVDVALRHLMEATGAHDVFVDRNVDDSDLGLVAEVVHEVIRPGFESVVDEEIWRDERTGEERHSRIAYSSLPTVRRHLEVGRPFVVSADTLPLAERSIYTADGCESELNIPILAGGHWVGSIGFADYVEARSWSDEDVALLQTVGEMIGAFWERTESRARLEELVRSKDEFVAAVSHEIRTPLTAVVGLAEELLGPHGSVDESERRELLAIVAEQSAEVADIVDDLLVAARADIGTLVVDLQPVRVRAVVEEVTHLTSSCASSEDAFDAVEVVGPDLVVIADRLRLRQVLRNLVGNAQRHGGRRLRVSLQEAGGTVCVTVADDGPGVAEHDVAHIFEPYGRVHVPSTQPASVGLGLFVARNLAHLMRGELEYRRTAGWTEFVLTLPAGIGAASVRLREEVVTGE